MTKDELFELIDLKVECLRNKAILKDAVEDYTEALIAANPNVSGSLQDFIDEVEYMMGLYGKQRYTQAEAQRDKLAEKLDDIMRLGSNDR